MQNKYQEQMGQSQYLYSLIKKNKRIILTTDSHSKINSHFCVVSSKRSNQSKQNNDADDQSFRPLKPLQQTQNKANVCQLKINRNGPSPTRKNNYIGIVQLKRQQPYELDNSITPYQNRKRNQSSISKYRKDNNILLKRALATFLEESKNKWLIVKQATNERKRAKHFELFEDNQNSCKKIVVNTQPSKKDSVEANYQQLIKSQMKEQQIPKQSVKKNIPRYKNKKLFRNSVMAKKKESQQMKKTKVYEAMNLSHICDTKIQIKQLGIHEKIPKSYTPKKNSNFKNKSGFRKQGKSSMQDTLIMNAKNSSPFKQLEKTFQKSLQGVINFSRMAMRQKQLKEKVRPRTADKGRKLCTKSPSRYDRKEQSSKLMEMRGWDDLPENNQKDIDFL